MWTSLLSRVRAGSLLETLSEPGTGRGSQAYWVTSLRLTTDFRVAVLSVYDVRVPAILRPLRSGMSRDFLPLGVDAKRPYT